MRKVFKTLAFMILIVTFLTGCMNIDQRILDDIQLATAVGYEYLDEDTLNVTAVFPTFQPDKTVKNETYNASSTLSKEVRDKLSMQSEKPFVSGKIEVALYEKSTAERGIADLLDTFLRDPSVGSNVYLGILEGSPKEILRKQYGIMDNGIFLSNLIEQNIKNGMIPKTNLHQFTYKLHAEGIDSMLPILTQKNGNIVLSAIALFDEDKMVDEIGQDKFFVFKMLLERKSRHESYSLKLSDGQKISIFNINSKSKFDIPAPMTESEIKINLTIKAIIREFMNGATDIKKNKQIEKEIQAEINKNAEKLLKQFQEKNVDPIGIGEEVRTRTRQWDRKRWEELYPNIKITVNTKVEILESGVVE